MRHVSIFPGVEAATPAWEPPGWEPVRLAESDGFPGAVSAEAGDISWAAIRSREGAHDGMGNGDRFEHVRL